MSLTNTVNCGVTQSLSLVREDLTNLRVVPNASTNTVDLGSSSVKFKDGYFAGGVNAAGGGTLVAPTITNPSITGPTPVAFSSGTTLALTQALHANRVLYVTDVAAAYTMPAATGTGDKYTIFIGATQTGASSIVAAGSDVFKGTALLFADGGDTCVGFATSNATTIDLYEASNTTGGMIGGIYEFWDVASGVWAVRIVSDAGGTEATPFS